MLSTLFPDPAVRLREAQERLAKDVERRKNSYPIQDFAKRRSAALKHTRKARV